MVCPLDSRSCLLHGYVSCHLDWRNRYVCTEDSCSAYLIIANMRHLLGTLTSEDLTPSHFQLSKAPTLRTMICLPLFLFASGLQHDCHEYLFSLKRYSLPNHPLFRLVVCPHYTAECVIYLSLALLAAPSGRWINRTLFCALVFVVVNLGVTASITRRWYARRFGEDAVRMRWRMIPWIY